MLRLAAKTEGQRDDWVEAINTNLVRSNQIAEGSEMGWARVSVVMKRMGKNKSMSQYIKPVMKMYRNLEDECQRDYAVAKVLERVEAAEPTGRGVDLEAAQATQVSEPSSRSADAGSFVVLLVSISLLTDLCSVLRHRKRSGRRRRRWRRLMLILMWVYSWDYARTLA